MFNVGTLVGEYKEKSVAFINNYKNLIPMSADANQLQWGHYFNVVFRIPENAVDFDESTGGESNAKIWIGTTSEAQEGEELYLSRIQLQELEPQFQNILVRQGVTLQDDYGKTYQGCFKAPDDSVWDEYEKNFVTNFDCESQADYVVHLAEKHPLPPQYYFDQNAQPNGKKSEIKWLREDIPEGLKLTYSSLLPYGPGIKPESEYAGVNNYFFNLLESEYIDQWIFPAMDTVMKDFKLHNQQPEFFILLESDEPLGVNRAQSNMSNADYMGQFIQKIDQKIKTDWPDHAPRLFLWHDPFHPNDNGFAEFGLDAGAPLGSFSETLDPSKSYVPQDAIFGVWQYENCPELNQTYSRYFNTYPQQNFQTIGVSGYTGPSEDINSQHWASLAASDPDVIGIMASYWLTHFKWNVALDYIIDTINLGWNAKWAILETFEIKKEELDRKYTIRGKLTGKEQARVCRDNLPFPYQTAQITELKSREKIQINPQWQNQFKIEFYAKGGVNPSVQFIFYDVNGVELLQQNLNFTITANPNEYQLYSQDNIMIPAQAVSIDLNITATSQFYLDDLVLYQKLHEANFPK